MDPLSDFSKLQSGVPVFCEVAPKSAHEVSGIVKLALRHGVSLRTRGNGHALNGSSLPQPDELVVHTRELTEVTYQPDGTVSAGAGVILWPLDAQLRARGWTLPVINDGYAGPSVGGFVAAGGFGPGSRLAGGFWDNVAEITMVDGDGRIRRLPREDPLFPWVFGSMGQLGTIVDAKLDVRACAAAAPAKGAEPPAAKPPGEAGRLFWFTLFVPESNLDHALAELDSLELRRPDTFAFRNRYTYFIAHRRVVAPLVWPHPTPCYAVGSWGILNDTTPQGIEKVLAFDADFMQIALRNGYRRYVQSELPSGPALYERYFGSQVFSQFRALKQAHDPANVLNRGWVFALPNGDGLPSRDSDGAAPHLEPRQ
jgi:FAD/FMN-containing dehydrogenase